MRLAVRGFLLSMLAFIVGCDGLSLDTYWRSGSYRLIAVDSRGQMALVDTRGGNGDLVGPTVFSIGANEKFIVVAQHPATNGFGDFNRSVTNYFVVGRTSGSKPTDKGKVRGPLTKDELEKLSASLSLPKFNKTFNDLKEHIA